MGTRTAIAAAGLILLGSCARPAPPAPQPASRVPLPLAPRPAPVPAPSSDWRDWPITSGTWRFRQDARGSIALFGAPGTDALFTIRCDRAAGAVYLSRAGDARSASMTIRTTTLIRALPVQPTGAIPPYLATALRSDDRLLDAIGFSRGRFLVEAPPLAALAIPAWPEVLRVTEDCRG